MTRAEIESAIEMLIDHLNEMDGDCDREEGGDLEPSISDEDLEQDLSDWEPECDCEVDWPEFKSAN